MTISAEQRDVRLPVQRWHYVFAVVPPILFAALRTRWTFDVIDRYAASRGPYSFERASEWYRLAFTWPETVLAASLVVFVLLIAAVPKARRRGVIIAASVASVVAFLASIVLTFNYAFANFKEIIG